VGLSRSALAERFTQFVGQPPMHYLMNWRMQLAANHFEAVLKRRGGRQHWSATSPRPHSAGRSKKAGRHAAEPMAHHRSDGAAITLMSMVAKHELVTWDDLDHHSRIQQLEPRCCAKSEAFSTPGHRRSPMTRLARQRFSRAVAPTHRDHTGAQSRLGQGFEAAGVRAWKENYPPLGRPRTSRGPLRPAKISRSRFYAPEDE